MINPFINISPRTHRPYLTAQCSINRLTIAKLPVKAGVADDVQGKQASEIFSREVLVKEIEKNVAVLGINLQDTPVFQLPLQMEYCLKSENIKKRQCAEEIAKKFGTRLGIILLTLKTGLPENRAAREDWTDEHWSFWANIENVIMVGGLASGLLGEKHIYYAQKVFETAGVEPYNIIAFENAAHVGTMGCAKLISPPKGINVVMDFGQTSIKRSIVKMENGEIADIVNLASVPSKYMEWHDNTQEMKLRRAVALHKYLIHTITDTCHTALRMGEIEDEIIISIASYVLDGKLNDKRGGYAKLSVLGDNYAECLAEEVSGVLKRPMRVRLVHDGTAVALHFADYKNSVCLTLGTFFGVGFPNILD